MKIFSTEQIKNDGGRKYVMGFSWGQCGVQTQREGEAKGAKERDRGREKEGRKKRWREKGGRGERESERQGESQRKVVVDCKRRLKLLGQAMWMCTNFL